MLYNDSVCQFEVVEDKLNQSAKFGWSWSIEGKEPYRHTAIALFFDDHPEFTVNFRPEKGANKAHAAFGECTGVITIEPVKTRRGITFQDYVEVFSVITHEAKTRARNIILQILSYKPPYYNLTTSNCRHHVERVIDMLTGVKEQDKQEHHKQKMDQVRDGDQNRFIAGGSGAILAIGGLLAGAVAIVSAFTNKDDENKERRQRHYQ